MVAFPVFCTTLDAVGALLLCGHVVAENLKWSQDQSWALVDLFRSQLHFAEVELR
jgi:hypothetical protein